MRLFKRENGYWYIEYERNKRVSLKTKNKQKAIKLFKEFQALYYQRKAGIIRKSITLSDFLNEYIEWVSESRSQGTYKKILTITKQFLEFCGNIPIDALDVKLFDRYIIHLRKKKLSFQTINGHIRHLKAAFNKAVNWNYIDKNPIASYKLLKIQEKLPRFMMPEQIHKVASIIDNKILREIFYFLVYTGMRRGELVSLTWKQIDLKNGIIILDKTKNKKVRIIPIHPFLKRILLEKLEEDPDPRERVFPVKADFVTKGLKRYFRKAGIPEFRVHDLRHTFASLLAMEGVSLKIVKELLGHSDYKTTEIYAHIAEQTLFEAVKRLPSNLDNMEYTNYHK
ncbi:tyrosine-type recombinase/integrase [Desulfurobacterium sp. TC5-1]|uniref:tyrosine-type recombinase/integrase n=1 Tax=Desulfurobacterium sp. TC5-1 TaxID=1158318 RepID=UPI0003B45C5E|nr:tyrosine-type recombinase/integrase [Desulfurobacterium sp. TC5-1]